MNKEEPTLLSHFNEVRESYIPEGGLTSVIICAQTKSENDTMKVLTIHREIVEFEENIEKLKHLEIVDNKKFDKVSITGLLLGQGNAVVHLLEGPSNSVLHILTRLSDYTKSENSLHTCRIIYNVEDRPKRYFPEWFSSILTDVKTITDENITEENSVEIVHELATNLLEIGNGIQIGASEILELNEYTDNLPSKGLILALANSQLFFKVEEFVEVFVGPFNLQLESERTWPLEKLVNY